jgi:hypothetical protein
MNLARLLFHVPYPPAPPVRDLTPRELSDIARLEQAVAIHQAARRALLAIGIVDARITYDPVDSASQCAWEIEQLQESACEIRRQPEIEAERAE